MDGGWRWRMEECSVRNWPSLGRPQWFTAGEQSFTTHEQTWITISCSGYAHTDAISRHRRASIIRHHYPSLHISLTVRCFHDDDGCDGKNLNQRHGGITQFATRLCTEKNWERQSGKPSTFHFNLTVRNFLTCTVENCRRHLILLLAIHPWTAGQMLRDSPYGVGWWL